MLISHSKKFIFIHIYKNAGTSIANALMPHAAGRWQWLAGRMARKLNITGFGPKPYQTHIKATELIDKMGREKYKSYFSFAVIRNPWDWQVSLYKYGLKEPTHFQRKLYKNFGSFENYIEWRVAEDVKFQKDFIFSEDGEQLVDFIGRFETIDTDFQKVCSRFGIVASLPKLNVSNTKPYRKYYNEKTIELVRQAFEPDISLFEYSF